MLLFIKIIGSSLVFLGGLILIKPEIFNKVITWFAHDNKRIYTAGVVRFIVGVILIISRHNFIIVALGILMVLDVGHMIFIGVEKCKDILRSWVNRPKKVLRLLAFVPLLCGLLIVLIT